MTTAIQRGLIRIWSNDDRIMGSGFLSANRFLFTCAHVISDALNLPRGVRPKVTVEVDFPFVAKGEKLSAAVVCWYPKQKDNTGDIAGLELHGDMPQNAQPIQLVGVFDTWGHPFQVYGFPVNRDNGVWASGILRNSITNGHIQIEDTKGPGYAISPGFSGSPVWDETIESVIGMVAVAEPKATTKAAFIIPANELLAALPSKDQWIDVRSDLMVIKGSMNEILVYLLKGSESLPKIADKLWGETEILTNILDNRFSQTGSNQLLISQLQYVSELIQINQTIRGILRKLFRNDRHSQYRESLITQLNNMVDCLRRLEQSLS